MLANRAKGKRNRNGNNRIAANGKREAGWGVEEERRADGEDRGKV